MGKIRGTVGEMVRKKRGSDIDVPSIQRPMTPAQLANYLQISLATLKRLAPNIPSIRVGGQIRFIAGDVLEALKKKESK